jgi:hypothetical protein
LILRHAVRLAMDWDGEKVTARVRWEDVPRDQPRELSLGYFRDGGSEAGKLDETR